MFIQSSSAASMMWDSMMPILKSRMAAAIFGWRNASFFSSRIE
jgi:hypothetical protein